MISIFAAWDSEYECNVYRVRGIGDDYSAFYKSLYTEPTRTIRAQPVFRSMWSNADFPWDYIWFYDVQDETRFRESYNAIITHEDSRLPVQPLKDPQGYSWCGRCRTFHENGPPWEQVEKDLIQKLSDEITREIDAEILAELLRLSKKEE